PTRWPSVRVRYAHHRYVPPPADGLTRRAGTTGHDRGYRIPGHDTRGRTRPAANRLRPHGLTAMTALARKWRNWQTRRIQDPVVATPWGFKSPLSHFATPGIPALFFRVAPDAGPGGANSPGSRRADARGSDDSSDGSTVANRSSSRAASLGIHFP